MKLKYKIKKVKPNIFAVIVEDSYDRAMLFCRVQEYYESANKKFRGNDFSIWDYIRWYSKEHNDTFTYTRDWGGFNIPFDILWNCYQSCVIETPYDETMREIMYKIDHKMNKDKKAYVIGVDTIESDTFDHELCHGLYYTNNEYKTLVNEITENMDIVAYTKLKKNLYDMGYAEQVTDDEIQAYLCTNHDYAGFNKGVNKKELKALHRKCVNVFKKF
jgi:hypothetical protein